MVVPNRVGQYMPGWRPFWMTQPLGLIKCAHVAAAPVLLLLLLLLLL
jgi:hypothetical protein